MIEGMEGGWMWLPKYLLIGGMCSTAQQDDDSTQQFITYSIQI